MNTPPMIEPTKDIPLQLSAVGRPSRSEPLATIMELMHYVARKNVKDQQEDQRDSDDEQHDADNHENHTAMVG